MNELMVAEVGVKQDTHGRFCLNDLHRASGGESRHQPGKWLGNKQTAELIAEYQITGIPVIESKQGLGTFVAKDLVYDYAMWISPAFKVKVIRAYDAMVRTPQIETPEIQVARGLLAAQSIISQQKAEIAYLEPKAAALDRIAESEGSMNITNAAKTLKIQPKELFAFLDGHRWTYRRPGTTHRIAYQDKIQTGYMEHKVTIITSTDGTERVTEQARVTAKGLAKLAVILGVKEAA